MSGQCHCRNNFNRAFLSRLPVAEYQTRLLQRCLRYYERRPGDDSLPKSSAVAAPAKSGSSDGVQPDVLDLLEFLQQEAIPYEVKTPPYAQAPPDPRRKGLKGTGVRTAKPATQPATATAGSTPPRSGRGRQPQSKQPARGDSGGVAAGNLNPNIPTSSSTRSAAAGTAATAPRAPAPANPRARSPARDASPADLQSGPAAAASDADAPTQSAAGAAAAAAATPAGAAAAQEPPASDQATALSPPAARSNAPRLRQHPPPGRQTVAGGTAQPSSQPQRPASVAPPAAVTRPPGVPSATANEAPPQGRANGGVGTDAAATPRPKPAPTKDPGTAAVTRGSAQHEGSSPAAKMGSTTTSSDGSSPAAPRTTGDGDISAGAGLPAGCDVAVGQTATAAGGTDSSASGSDGSNGNVLRSSSSSSSSQAPAVPSLEEARRAAVVAQWKQFMEPRKGPPAGGPAAVAPRSVGTPPTVPRDGRVADAAAAVPARAAAPSATAPASRTITTSSDVGAVGVSDGAANPGAPRPRSAPSPPPTSTAARPQPPVVQDVPGLSGPPPLPLPPPVASVPGAATGEPVRVSAAPLEPPAVAAPPPPAPAPRMPAALLPLTLQGRIALMEAAMEAAAAQRGAGKPRLSSVGAAGGLDSDRAGRQGRVVKGSPGEAATKPAAVAAPLAGTGAGAAVAAGGGEERAAAGPSVRAARTSPGTRVGKSTALTAAESLARTGGAVVPSPQVLPQPQRAPPAALLAAAGPAGTAAGTAAAGAAPPARGNAALPPPPPPGPVARARELLSRLVRYLPTGREDGPALLAPYQRYSYGPYQEAATAAAEHPELLLRPLGLQQLSYIAAAYAAAGHQHEPFLRALAAVAVEKMAAAATGRRHRGSGAGGGTVASAATPSPAAPLTFRTACVMLTALARLSYRDGRLTAALGRWLAAALRSGTVTPRAKWKGTWLSAALWSYATLERAAARQDDQQPTAAAIAGRGGGAAAVDVSAAGAVLFTEAAEALRVDPGWIQLMDCREALWALWALRVATALYDPADGGGAAAAPVAATPMGQAAPLAMAAAAAPTRLPYVPQPLVELQLLERAASQFDQLNPGHLAEAFAVAAEVGLGTDPDLLAGLRRCSLARVAAVRPQPLAVMVAALAVMKVRDVVWLTALAAACRNQMINMRAEQMVVVLHSFSAALRFYHLPLFHAAAVMATLPGFARLGALGAGDLVRLAAAYAGVGHYEAVLMRRTAERILTLGSAATPWQRASVLQSCARLAFRSNALLRAVAAEAFALAAAPRAPTVAQHAAAAAPPLPPAQLASVAAACGQLQFRPPGLLTALHSFRGAEWRRLGLPQRAALCWSLLVLTGGLVELAAGGGGDQDGGGGGSVAAGVRQQQHQQLVGALVEYLGSLAATDIRSWPAATDSLHHHHHGQLLAACAVLAWPREQQQQQHKQQQQQQAEPERQPQRQKAQLLQPAAERRQVTTATEPLAALRAAVERLPAAGARRALAAHNRLRLAVLGPWATAVGDVVRQAVEAAAAADTAADAAAAAAAAAERPAAAAPVRPWLAVGVPGRAAAAAAGRWRVRGGAVKPGLLLCGGAVGVDVAVELEVEEVAAAAMGKHTGGDGNTSRQKSLGSGGGDGAEQRRRRVHIALELCAPPPPGAAAAAAAAGTGGGGVVRSSQWLLSGSAALRVRLLAGRGWRVVAVRERTWQGLRSPEQQRRAVAAMLRRAVLRGMKQEGLEQEGLEQEEEEEEGPAAAAASVERAIGAGAVVQAR